MIKDIKEIAVCVFAIVVFYILGFYNGWNAGKEAAYYKVNQRAPIVAQMNAIEGYCLGLQQLVDHNKGLPISGEFKAVVDSTTVESLKTNVLIKDINVFEYGK